MPDLDQLAVELAAISARLKEAGEGGMSRSLATAIGKAVDPLQQQVESGLRPRLPDAYAEVLGPDLSFTRRTFTTGDEARVIVYMSVRGTKQRRLRRLDSGILAHPVYGNRKHWSDQQVRPGFFSGPVQDAAPQVREAIQQALDEVKRKVATG